PGLCRRPPLTLLMPCRPRSAYRDDSTTATQRCVARPREACRTGYTEHVATRRLSMFRNILVPLDGSPLSEQALPVAARLARAANATLHLVHVHTPATLNPIVIE